MHQLPRPAVLVSILGGLTAFGAFSFDMYLPAFPAIAADLHVPAAQVQLTLTAALVGLGLGQFVAGPLSDRYGRRAPVLAGTVVFAVASALIAVAPNIAVFVILRLLQGFGGGIGTTVSRAVVRDLYSGAAASRYLSRILLAFGVAPIVAPTVGAAVLRVTSWRGIFLLLSAYGVLITFVVLRLLPETLPAERRRTGGAAEIVAGFRRLGSDRLYLGYALAQSLSFAGLFAYLSSSSFVLQDGFGVSPQAYGLIFGLNSVGLVAAGQLSARAVTRRTPRRLLFAALFVGLGATVILLAGAGLHRLALVIPMMFLFVASLGVVFPNSTALALDQYPEMAGTSAALLGALQSLISGFAGPLVASLGAATGVPMAAVMLGFAAVSLVTVSVLTRPVQAAA
ncbi:multidrug effflux MFS transporter [Hamadaea tsunoensis]|uniref:multidrug effflux MFS transporter n=1 Tax=Hamadaea tsunoensis TaxID=53368 RepID=UPI0003FFD0E9|nr:multidrug effflux MFS transporter [Hamadaea tsunoensis]